MGMEAIAHELPHLRALETVCCLECGDVYAKPAAGGTVQMNPGCPGCGYVGWIPLRLPAEPPARLRSGGDPRLRRVSRSR